MSWTDFQRIVKSGSVLDLATRQQQPRSVKIRGKQRDTNTRALICIRRHSLRNSDCVDTLV